MIRAFLFSIILLLSFFSCNSDNTSPEQRPDFFLVQATPGLNALIDSADLYCDKIIMESKMGAKKETLTLEYGPKIKYYENSINEAFDRAAILSKQKKLGPGVYDRWFDVFNLKQLADRNKKLQSLGIDLSYIPAEDITIRKPAAPENNPPKDINLSQQYINAKKTFAIKLPAGWSATEQSKEGNTTMIAGPADNKQGIRDAAVEVNIMDFTKELSTEDFYYGNIALIKNNSKNFRLLEESDMGLTGIKSKIAVFSCINNGVPITSIQAYFFLNKKGYILNGTSSSAHFNEYKDLFIAIIKSFRIVDK